MKDYEELGKRVAARVDSRRGLDPLTGHCPSCGTDGPSRHAKWCPLKSDTPSEAVMSNDGRPWA